MYLSVQYWGRRKYFYRYLCVVYSRALFSQACVQIFDNILILMYMCVFAFICCIQVSWVRRKSDDTNLDLLTVGLHTYSGDTRYKLEFQYPNNWRLKIESAVREDEGTYECQISTHPPRIIQKNLYVSGEYFLLYTYVLYIYIFHINSTWVVNIRI